MLNEDQIAFTTKYLAWVQAVERSAQRRLLDTEVAELIRVGVKSGMLQQEVLQNQIIEATNEFLVSLRVEEGNEENII